MRPPADLSAGLPRPIVVPVSMPASAQVNGFGDEGDTGLVPAYGSSGVAFRTSGFKPRFASSAKSLRSSSAFILTTPQSDQARQEVRHAPFVEVSSVPVLQFLLRVLRSSVGVASQLMVSRGVGRCVFEVFVPILLSYSEDRYHAHLWYI